MMMRFIRQITNRSPGTRSRSSNVRECNTKWMEVSLSVDISINQIVTNMLVDITKLTIDVIQVTRFLTVDVIYIIFYGHKVSTLK